MVKIRSRSKDIPKNIGYLAGNPILRTLEAELLVPAPKTEFLVLQKSYKKIK
jgi:hypothetical protein